MLNIPASALAQTGRYLLALTLVLGGGATLTPATAAPLTAKATAADPAAYYLNGKLSDKATVDGLDPKSIAFMNVLEEATARKVFGTATGGVVIVVTKDNQNSAAVLALNNKIARMAPLVPATPAQKAATAAVEAYIKKTYPNAAVHSISGPRPLPGATAPRYKAEIKDGGQTKQLYFDANGQPVSN